MPGMSHPRAAIVIRRLNDAAALWRLLDGIYRQTE